jgi:hypothetical protein
MTFYGGPFELTYAHDEIEVVDLQENKPEAQVTEAA